MWIHSQTTGGSLQLAGTLIYVPDPDALADEFAARNVEFSEPLKDTHDGLRFELKDAYRSGWIVVAVSLAATVAAWIVGLRLV